MPLIDATPTALAPTVDPVTDKTSLLTSAAAVWAYPLWKAVHRAGVADDIAADVAKWAECLEVEAISALDPYRRFAYIAGALPEFRTLVHYRIRHIGMVQRLLLKKLYPGLSTLTLEAGSIGPGLFIQHGLGSIITAEHIGKNCWINQHVSLGYTAKGRPVIGDNVRVGAGAAVLGPISIGNDVTIGANATILHDVAPRTVMVSPPAMTLEQAKTTRRAQLEPPA